MTAHDPAPAGRRDDPQRAEESGPMVRVSLSRLQELRDAEAEVTRLRDLLRASAVDKQFRLEVVGGHLCAVVGYCTCGSPLGEFPHEPYCGVEPIAPVGEIREALDRGGRHG